MLYGRSIIPAAALSLLLAVPAAAQSPLSLQPADPAPERQGAIEPERIAQAQQQPPAQPQVQAQQQPPAQPQVQPQPPSQAERQAQVQAERAEVRALEQAQLQARRQAEARARTAEQARETALLEVRAQEMAREQEAAAAELQAMRAQLEAARRELERAAREVATQRLSDNRALYARMLTSQAAPQAELGLVVTDSPGGVLVTRVRPGSGAAGAGVEAGDIVRSINGIALTGVSEPSAEFQSRVRSVNPGDRVAIVVQRDGRELPLNVTVQREEPVFLGIPSVVATRAPDAATAVVRSDNPQSVLWTFGLASRLWSDMELVALTPDLGRYFSVSEGLLVVRAPSDDELDLVDGDVIVTISGRPPSSPEHAMRILASFEPGETIELAIMRQGAPRTITYALPPEDNG